MIYVLQQKYSSCKPVYKQNSIWFVSLSNFLSNRFSATENDNLNSKSSLWLVQCDIPTIWQKVKVEESTWNFMSSGISFRATLGYTTHFRQVA